MAVLTAAAFLSKWNARFADNTTREISEEDMREFVEDIKDSFQNITGATTVESWKSPCAVATTGNITLSGEQTIDGVLTSGSRVLVKNQTTTSQNGIYVSAAGAWSRSTDADAAAELEGAAVGVTQGTTQQNTVWLQTSDSINLGTTAIQWQQIGFGFSGISGSTGATDNAIIRADGTGGSTLQSSAVTISDAGRIQNVTDPSSAQDVATKNYVDSALSGAVIQSVTKVISTAEILTGNSSPVVLLAAQGAGTFIHVMSPIIMRWNYNTAAFATNTTAAVYYNSTGALTTADNVISLANKRYQTLPTLGVGLPDASMENVPITWVVSTGNPTGGGTSTLTIHFKYAVLSIS